MILKFCSVMQKRSDAKKLFLYYLIQNSSLRCQESLGLEGNEVEDECLCSLPL